ncbi:MAG TPA: DUF3194 domain-containing protein [Candidatus Bathyarchaeia archaeon]|nr:DUF3194 domain-containing protein [Candidatus Bathyarchaeia archaeon]
MEELDIPELTSKQVEELCSIAEEAARKSILAKVPSKKIEILNICAETEGIKPAKLTVDVEVILSPSAKEVNVQELVDKAVDEAFGTAEKYLKELKCLSPK